MAQLCNDQPELSESSLLPESGLLSKSGLLSESGLSAPPAKLRHPPLEQPGAASGEPEQNCAYNHSRECFLGLHIACGDFSPASFSEWMGTLTPNSNAGLWMVPFRGIPAAETLVPLDLLYLDKQCRVIDAVEFYPTFRASPSSPPAASVLALPAHAIFSSHTQPGDQLIVCRAEEMVWRLERLARSGQMETESSAGQPGRTAPEPARPESERMHEEAGTAMMPMLPPPAAKEFNQAASQHATGSAVIAITPPAPSAAPPPPGSASPALLDRPWMVSSRQSKREQQSWLGRWLFPDSPDPRRAVRKHVNGLVAHFFTGGVPHAHEIRDVSASGLFVVTAERWYPGTVIRMTLTRAEGGQTPAERSITVHARAVRWGNDGVGLEFVLEPQREGRRADLVRFDPADGERLNRFLKRIREAGR
jgi:hypothetical protein